MNPAELIAERDRLRVANASLIASNTTLRAQRNRAEELARSYEAEARLLRTRLSLALAGVGVNTESAGAGHGVRTGFPKTIPAAGAQVGVRGAVALVGISARAVCPAGSYSAVRGGCCHAE